MKKLMNLVMVMLMVCMVSSLAQAATYVSENFNDGSLDAALTDPQASWDYSNQEAELRYPVGGAYGYLGFFDMIQTVDHDWNTNDFIMEVSWDYAAGSDPGFESVFIGIGDASSSGSPYGTSIAYGVQITRTEMYEYISTGSAAIYVGDGITAMSDISAGVTRLRATRVGEDITWELDAGYNGTFAADYTRTNTNISGLFNNDGTNSHLFFGAGKKWFDPGLVSFDDLAITAVPEPATMALLAIGGVMALRRKR